MHLLRPGSRLRQTSLTSRSMGGVSWTPASSLNILVFDSGPEWFFTDADLTVPAGNGDQFVAWVDVRRSLVMRWPVWSVKPVARLSGGRWSAEFPADGLAYLRIQLAAELPVTLGASDANGGAVAMTANRSGVLLAPTEQINLRRVVLAAGDVSAATAAAIESWLRG